MLPGCCPDHLMRIERGLKGLPAVRPARPVKPDAKCHFFIKYLRRRNVGNMLPFAGSQLFGKGRLA